MSLILPITLTLLLVCGSLEAQTLPNPTITPGRVLRPLTQSQVCSTRWGKDARHVTEGMKRQIALLYGMDRKAIVGYGKGPCCEFDHLIPRELGGADVIENVWPQPWVEAKQKDVLENRLHALVCSRQITLTAAQKAIATDWVAISNISQKGLKVGQ